MGAASAHVRTIKGEELTTWAVLTGGTHVRMYFIGSDGAAHRLVLPFDVLSGLLMTLPRILQIALMHAFPMALCASYTNSARGGSSKARAARVSSFGSEHRTASTLPSL